jgi:hypothetical protein
MTKVKDTNPNSTKKIRLLISVLILMIFLGIILRYDVCHYYASIKGYAILENSLLFYLDDELRLSSFFFLITLCLFGISLLKKNNYFLVIEYFIWAYKLFFLKNCYTEGFGGTYNEEVLIYDFCCCFGRIMIAITIINTKVPILKCLFFSFAFSVVILIIKIYYFSGNFINLYF